MTSASQTPSSRSFPQRVKHILTAPVLGIFASAAFVLLNAASALAAEAPMLLDPSQGQQFDSPVPAISGTAPAGSEVLVFIDDRLNGTAKVSKGSFSYTPFLPLGSGGHAIALQARTTPGGELSEKSPVTFIAIIPNPAPTLLVPEENTTLGQDRVWLGGVGRNNSLIRVLVDGAERVRTQVRNHPSGTGSFGVELGGLALGEHAITAIARDSRGKESFVSNSVAIAVLPKTPAPVLFRPVVNADSGIERPFITGIAKNGLTVSIVIDGKHSQSIPPGQDLSGVINFAWQPRTPLDLGRHTIEAYASDRGKLSNNSSPVFWQVGEVAAVGPGIAQALPEAAPEEPGKEGAEEAGAEQLFPISVTKPETSRPLTVKDELAKPEEPLVPDVLPEQGQAPSEPQGRVVADDEGVLGESKEPDAVAIAPGEEGAGDEVTEIAPGAVVRKTGEEGQEFAFNTSLIIGIVILVFLLLSILVWYIQEKRAQGIGERVVNIFREEDEAGSGTPGSGASRLPGDVHTDSVRPPFGKEPLAREQKKEDSPPPPPEPPRHNPPFGFDGPDDLPPPPPPMF